MRANIHSRKLVLFFIFGLWNIQRVSAPLAALAEARVLPAEAEEHFKERDLAAGATRPNTSRERKDVLQNESSPQVPPAHIAGGKREAAAEKAEKSAERELEKSYRIAAGDVVAINVQPVDEYSKEVTVQPDGKIELPLIGAVLVKGLTARELQDLLQQKYGRYVANPQVTVNVRRFSGRRVAIIGEIRTPGYYEYRDGMRLLELVSLAGGLSDNAKASKVTVFRPGMSAAGSFRVNFKAVLKGDLRRDVAVAPGDTVFIPKGNITVGAQWAASNILPWATLMTLIASLAVIVHQNTRSNP